MIVLLVLLSLGLLTCFIGFYYASQLSSSIKNAQCQISRVMNTVAYGGITKDHSSYFTGVKTAEKVMGKTSNHVKDMVENLTRDVEAGVVKAQTFMRKAREDLEYVADPHTPNGTLVLSYNYPTPGSPPILESSFIKVLGYPHQPLSLLGGLSLLISGVGTISNLVSKL
jgi:hypothetical protein